MPNVPRNQPGFVGITDAKRRAIYEAEAAAAKIGVLPDDPEVRKAIRERLERRLARKGAGWDFSIPETVVRTDEYGVARIIPKSQAVGWISGLPAAPDSRDPSSRGAQVGRTTPLRETVLFPDPGPIKPADPREAAQRFYARIRKELETRGYIPRALAEELWETGWKLGQPVPLHKVEEWCSRFQQQWHNKYGRK